MAPKDESEPQRSHCPMDDNPFIAFRKLADETVAAMLHGLIGLPSVFNTLDPNERWIPFDEQARRQTMESWGASPQEEEYKNARDAAGQPHADGANGTLRKWPERLEQRSHYGLEPARYPYIPRESPPNSGFFQPWSSADSLFYSHENMHQPFCNWLQLYLLGSPYSPVSLENHPDLGQRGASWRRAFEDLLNTQYGVVLKPEEVPRRRGPPFKCRKFGKQESTVDWALRLAKQRELCECAYKTMHGSLGHTPQWAHAQDSLTELDMYEQLFKTPEVSRQSANNHAGKSFDTSKLATLAPENMQEDERSAPHRATERVEAVPEPKKNFEHDSQPGVISTLTTTERVVLPDGTTNTKVVLKKKFSDGREETNETVHSAKGQGQSGISSVQDWAAERKQVAASESRGQEQNAEKKGWFWS